MAKSNFIVRGGANFNPLYQELNKAQKRMNGFKVGITKTMKGLGIALGAVAVGKYIKDSISAASELEGAMVGLQSIVEGQGKSFNKAQSFVNSYVKDGLIPLTDAITAYKNLSARGYDDTQIKTTMERLKDAAAFGRQSNLTLGEAVKTATEGLKNENSVLVDNAGVTKNVSMMWDEYARSIGTTRNQLTQQQKIQAEVNGIMNETKWQVGDAARYTNTFAGRLAGLKQTLQEIKVNIGNAFMPIANIVLPLLQALANALSTVTGFISAFSQALFGKTLTVQAQQTKATAVQVGAMEDLGGATKQAGKAAEKAGKQAKKALAPFDELNILQKASDTNSGGSGGVSGGGISSGGGVETLQSDDGTGGIFGSIGTKAQEMAERVKKAFEPVGNAFNNLKEALGNLGQAIKNNEYINNFFERLGNFLSRVGTGTIRSLAGAIDILAGVVNVAAGIIGGDFETGLKGVEQIVGGVADIIIGTLYPVFPELSDKLKKMKEEWGEKWQALKEDVKKYGDPTKLEASDFAYYIRDKLVETWEDLKKKTTDKFEEIKKIIGEKWEGIKTDTETILNNMKTKITGIWDNIKTTTATKWEEIKTKLNGVLSFIKTTFLTGWETAWGKVKATFQTIFDSLYGIVKASLNLIITAVNKVINGINRFKIDIPSWAADLANLAGFRGGSIGFNIPRIPALAKGGITSGPTLAMIGDNPGGKEVVSPLNDLLGMITTAVSSTNSNSSGDTTIIVKIGEDTITEKVVSNINRQSRISGKTIITV